MFEVNEYDRFFGRVGQTLAGGHAADLADRFDADREFRYRLRTGDTARARVLLAVVPTADQPGAYRVLLAAESGDAAEPGRELDACAAIPPGGIESLYPDEAFARLIAAPAFAGLRRRYPDPRPRPAAPPG